MLRRIRKWLLLRDPDLRYIVNVGVDEIPEVQDPITPATSILGAAGGDIDRNSRFLDSEEALQYFLMGMESKFQYNVRLLGMKGGLIMLLAGAPRKLEGPWLLVVDSDEGWIARMLVYNGVITGVQVINRQGIVYGRQALQMIDTAGGTARVTAIQLRRRLVDWDPERLSVYVRGVDRQHQFLVANLNILYLGLVAGSGQDATEEVLRNLEEYTRFHFRSEERLMDKFNYPQEHAEKHVREHRSFVDKVSGFVEAYGRGEAALTLDVLRFLAGWLQGHISGTGSSTRPGFP